MLGLCEWLKVSALICFCSTPGDRKTILGRIEVMSMKCFEKKNIASCGCIEDLTAMNIFRDMKDFCFFINKTH